MFHVPGKGKGVLILVTVVVAVIIPLIMINAQQQETAQPSEKIRPGVSGGGTAVNFDDYRDPQTALRQGINGYLDLSLTETTLRQYNITGFSEMNNLERFSIKYPLHKGNLYNFTLQLKFISHNPQVATEARITFDPHAEYADKSGAFSTDHKLILLNDLINYYPQEIVIRNGETRNVTMVVTLLSDLPSIKLQLDPVGINADFPIVGNLWGFIYVD